VMNAGGSCSEGGSYQQEVIVGDEDPSLSFVGSPSWAHTFEDIAIKDDLMAVNYDDEDDLVGISVLRNEDDNDNDSSCHNPEEAIDGMSDCSGGDFKDDPSLLDYQSVTGNKRKRGIDEVEQNESSDNYSRLLAGCKIIKKECSGGRGYLEEITLGGAENELTESSQSDDELHSLDDGELVEVKRELRSITRHDSGGSAANSDEENETRLCNTQKVTITLQPKVMATSQDDAVHNPRRIKYEISNEDFEEEDYEAEEEGRKVNRIQQKGSSRKVNGYNKPRLSYAQLIAEALMGAEKRRLTLNDIYVKINARHPYYSLGGDRGNIMSPPNWQNAVRHNLTLNKAFVKVPRPANEGRGSFWSLAPDSEKDIFKRLLRQQTLSNINSNSPSSSRNIYNRISSSSPLTPITLSVPSSKPKQLATVATQTYPASVHFDVSESPLLASSVSPPSPSPSPPLPLNKQYVTYQPSARFTKVPTPNIKVVRSVSGFRSDDGSTNNKLIPIASNKGNPSTTKPTIIYVTIPKRASPPPQKT